MATAKLKLYKVPGSNPQLTKPFRTVKMLQPLCAEHFPGTRQSMKDDAHPNAGMLDSPDGSVHPKSGWWEDCLAAGHDPYVAEYGEQRKKKETETRNIDGEEVEVVVGEVEYTVLRQRPNFEQVPFDIKAYSGVAIQDARERGWVFPQERGLAPYCEFRNCWTQNPKFRTPVGDYCTRDQAAVMMLYKGGDERSVEGVPMYIPVDDDANRFRQQLRKVDIDSPFGAGTMHEH